MCAVGQCPARPKWVYQPCTWGHAALALRYLADTGLPPEKPLARPCSMCLMLVQTAMAFSCCSRGQLLELLRRTSWEELPAHPSHTDLAFMKDLKQ